MPKHAEIALLNERIRQRAQEAIDDMNADPDIKAAGYPSVIVLETLRDLAVQMAYAVKARIKALPDDGKTDLSWVQEFFRKAQVGWVPGADDNSYPSTWTLSSKHIDGLAFDVAPSKDGKNPDWKAPDAIWEKMAAIGEKHGFSAGRRWKNKDCPHFEEP